MQILQRKIIKILITGASSIPAIVLLLLLPITLCLCCLIDPETLLHDTLDAPTLRFGDRKPH